jgi:hypothetical protein
MRRIIFRGAVMALTFALGLAGDFLFNGLGSAVENWVGTPAPVLQDVCGSTRTPEFESNLVTSNCGLLVVTIGSDRRLWLRGEEVGSLENTSKLIAKLETVFQWRSEAHAYRAGFERYDGVPAAGLIEKTVLIRANPSISFGELSGLIDVLRTTGARPIGLITQCGGYPESQDESIR